MNPILPTAKTEPTKQKLPTSKSGWEKAINTGKVNLETVISKCPLPAEAGLLRRAYLRQSGGFPCGA